MGRVYITSAGVMSPIGTGLEEFMDGLEKGIKGINYIQNVNTQYFPIKLGGEVKEKNKVLKTDLEIDRKEVFIDKSIEEVFRNNRDVENYSYSDRILNLGTGIDYFDLVNYVNDDGSENGGWEKYCQRSYKVVEKLCSKYNIQGGFNVNVSACVASTQAMGLSFRMIKNNNKKMIITGGFDSMLCHLHYMGFFKLGALSSWNGKPEESCRPFDKNRCGLVIGEGAAAYLFQDEEEANPDKILAEIVGYSSTMDAYMVTDPEPEGKNLAKCALDAIKEACITPNQIDCVNLHSTGTYKNDLAESKAMEIIFDDRFKKIPVFSLKGQIGHLIGACGAVEILAVIYSLKKQKVLPTINYTDPDPEVPLRIAKDEPLDMKINYVLKLNSAFGGQNTAFVFKRYE